MDHDIQHFDSDRAYEPGMLFIIGDVLWEVIGWEKRPNLLYRISVERT